MHGFICHRIGQPQIFGGFLKAETATPNIANLLPEAVVMLQALPSEPKTPVVKGYTLNHLERVLGP